MSTLLEARQIAFAYGERAVLEDVSLSVEPASIAALLGPNGCGKSTLLRILLGLLAPAAGEVRLQGVSVRRLSEAKIARVVAYVPQQTQVPFAFTALEVVAMARTFTHTIGLFGGSGDRAFAREALRRLGIEALGERIFATLSGGERQLVVLARALAQDTPLLLMDEPVSALDYGRQIQFLKLVSTLAKEEGKAVLLTTHNPEHALSVADRAVLIKEGKVLSDAAPKAVITPSNLALLYSLREADLHGYLDKTRLFAPAAGRFEGGRETSLSRSSS